MSKYLVSTCEVYRVATEAEAKQAIEAAKQDKTFTLTKYVNEYKERKQKGEVIDQYYKLTLTKVFNDIKEPESYVKVNYEKQAGFFPSPVGNDEDEE